MIKILDQPSSNSVISIAITFLNSADWINVIEALQAKMREYDKICWYLEMEDFRQDSQIDPFPSTAFDPVERNRFDRIALVADPVWHGSLSDLVQPLTGSSTAGSSPVQITFFSVNDQQRAHHWILEGTKFK
jgi:hypothetical protein